MQYSRQVAYVNCIIINATEISDCDCNKILTENNPQQDASNNSHSSHAHIKISAPEEFYIVSVIPDVSVIFTALKRVYGCMEEALLHGLRDKPFQPPKQV